MAKCGDSRTLFREWKDSIKAEYAALKRQDKDDPLVQVQLAHTSRMFALLGKIDPDMLNDSKYRKSIEGTVQKIKEQVYGAQEDAKDELTKRFRARFSGRLPVKVKSRLKKEVIKRVDYEDNTFRVTVYSENVPTDVKTYVFATGNDMGVADEMLTQSYEVRVDKLGEFTKQMQERGLVLGSNQVDVEAVRNSLQRVDDYVHGNVNSMLRVVEGLRTSKDGEAYARYVNMLIENMNPKAFKELELFIGNTGNMDTAGFVSARQIELYRNVEDSPARNKQTSLEAYIHEVVHSVTMFGFNADSDKSRKLRNELDVLVREAKKQLKVEDLYPENATEEEIQVAEELYEYVFKNSKGVTVGNQEFLVHAITNPQMMKALDKLKVEPEAEKWLDRLARLFHKALRVVLGEVSWENADKSMYEHAVNLVHRFAEINNEYTEKSKPISDAVGGMMDVVNDIDEYVADMIESGKEKILKKSLPERYPEKGTKLEKAKFLVKNLSKVVTNEEYRKAMGLMVSNLGVKPDSSLREIVGSFFERNSLAKNVDWLGLAAGKIDTARESVVNTTRSMVLEGFDKEISEEQERAVTRLLVDTDSGVLYKKHGITKLVKFLDSDEAIDQRVGTLKRKLKEMDSENYNWLEGQSYGLGRYMATHRGHIAQNVNAYAIASGVMSGAKVEYSKELENVVSELASLHALKMSKEGNVELVKELLDKGTKGVENVLEMYEAFKKQSSETVMKDAELHRVQGYTVELFDDGVEMEIHPVGNRKELEKLGFRMVRKFDRVNVKGQQLGLFVSNKYHRRERLRGATKMLSQKAKGTSLRDIVYRNSLVPKKEYAVEKTALDISREKIAAQMREGTLDLSKIEENMLPLLDAEGNVVDYRFAMDKKSKEELLEQNTKISDVLGRSNGHILDKVYSAEHNKRVLEVIKRDMEENWSGGLISDLTEYTVISPKSDIPELVDLYNLLPREFKEYAQSREDGSIAVPSYLKDAYFGYPHLSVASNKYSKNIPKWFNQIAGMAEALWLDVVKIAKSNILMKTPTVLISNLWSNFWFRVVNGANPVELMKDYVRSFRDVREYIKNNRDIVRLEYELKGDREKPQTQRVRDEIKEKEWKLERLKYRNENNPVKELVDAGMYQAIVEDVEMSTIEGSTIWDKLGKGIFGRMPKVVKDGFDILYFNQSTRWYKFNQEVLQISDLIARDVQNRSAKAIEERVVQGKKAPPKWWRDEKGWDKDRRLKDEKDIAEYKQKAKDIRLYNILESYVNYTRPSGRGEEYLNRIGLLMFTKYAKRIQRVVIEQGTNHPIKTFLSLLIDQGLLNIDTVQDQSILSKEWHTETHGAGNFYPFYNMLDHIENVITPALVKDSTWDFLPI